MTRSINPNDTNKKIPTHLDKQYTPLDNEIDLSMSATKARQLAFRYALDISAKPFKR